MEIAKAAYDRADSLTRARVDRLRYALGLLPRVNPQVGQRQQARWPAPNKACLVISADLELAWAWRYVKGVDDSHALAVQKAEQTRSNLPFLLDLFDRFSVPVTWATVGHLFMEGCERTNGKPHPGMPRPPYFENEFWRYNSGDWYDSDPCADFQDSPAWYAPDLLQAILSAWVKHEIACHAFSHIYCSDEHCPSEVMDAELAECRRLAARWGLTLKSFVFPGNLQGNFASLKKHGFTAYRCHNGYELDVPRQDELGLWQVPGGVCWEKPAGWPVKAWIGALLRCVDRAMETGTVLHLWLHPSCDPVNVERVFPALLDYVVKHRNDLQVTSMSGLTDWLTSQ